MIPEDSTIRLRADLVQSQVSTGNGPVWIVKDPLSRSMFYFSEQEIEILNLADGNANFKQIAKSVSQRMAPDVIPEASLARFFTEAWHQGLVSVAGAVGTRRVSDLNRRPPWWRNPLAVRVPGINPDRLLDRSIPFFRILFSKTAVWAIGILILVAAAVVLQRFDTLVQHLSVATARHASGQGLVALIVVVSVVKIIHEFAHALACKRFGGECRELGVMFLVGIPCLYCDVSDAWLLKRRWKRIFVSAAGMLAELCLASFAALIWVFTADGTVRDLCVTVMVVCSVTTFLFNGNPLLRYDGYYILSDLSGIPNLSSRSSRLIRGWIRSLLWGRDAVFPKTSDDNRKLFLVGYGIASGIYRNAIYFFILYMLYRLADRYGFGYPAGTAALAAGIWFCVRQVRPVLRRPAAPVASLAPSRASIWRGMMVVGGASSLLLIIGLIPLPQRVIAPMTIQPVDAAEVYVADAGAIVDSQAEGSSICAGDVIAELSDPNVERELESIRTRCAILTVELAGLRARRGSSRIDAARIPVVERALSEALKQRRLQEEVARRLVVTSPKDGRIFPPAITQQRRPTETADDREPWFWTGTPMQPMNRGAWLEEGTVLCVVGDPSRREAVVLVPQDQIEWIRPQQRATLLLADRRRGAVRGEVIEIASSPIRETLDQGQDGVAGRPKGLAAPRYRVRIQLEETPHRLPVRMTGLAKISVNHSSVFARIGRFLRQSFG